MKPKSKTNFIGIRITPEENAAIRFMAINEGRVFAEMVRQCIREAAERRGLPPLAYLENQAKETGAINDR